MNIISCGADLITVDDFGAVCCLSILQMTKLEYVGVSRDMLYTQVDVIRSMMVQELLKPLQLPILWAKHILNWEDKLHSSVAAIVCFLFILL